MQFRENALAKLEAPEDLDIPVRLTSSRAWLAVLAVGLLMAGGLLWAYAGSLPRTTTAAGVLIFPGGGFPLQRTVSGMVQRVFVDPGRFIEVAAPVAAVAVDRHVETVRAGAAGWVS